MEGRLGRSLHRLKQIVLGRQGLRAAAATALTVSENISEFKP
jgi:hypothetical protein